ncbi:unnamed protein product, partial [Callosobruchus maculatus]
ITGLENCININRLHTYISTCRWYHQFYDNKVQCRMIQTIIIEK